MGVADRLIMPAHHSERHDRAPVFDQHPRNDRVERPLARRDRIRMSRDRPETGAAVVQQHAAFRRQNSRTERREQRIDERTGVAVSVDGAEIDRVLMLDLGPARSRHRAVEADRPARTLGARLRQEIRDVYRHVLGVADKIIAYPIGRLARFGEEMQPVGLTECIAAERIPGESAQDHQRCHALPVGRAFIDLVSLVGGADRVDPVRALGGEVLFFVQAAQRFEPGDDLAHDRAVVKGFAAFMPDSAQRGGERRVAHFVPGVGRSAARQEKPRSNGITQLLLSAVPVGRDARRHHVTFLGRSCRRFEQFGERSGAVLAVERAPGIDRAGDRHRMRGLNTDLADAVLDIPIDRGLGGGPPGTVERHRQGPLR